jgi:uncharacterized protein
MRLLRVRSLKPARIVAATLFVAGIVGGCDKRSPQDELIPAVLDRDLAHVQELLNTPGVDVNWQPPGLGGTALAAAAQRNLTSIMEVLLAHGASPDATGALGITPLSSAAYHGHREAVALLIKADANLDVRDKSYNHTALIDAAWKGHAEIAEMLLEAGADINIRASDHRRAVDFARQYNHRKVEEMLIEAEKVAKHGEAVDTRPH